MRPNEFWGDDDDSDDEESVAGESYECPLCGGEVEDAGYCGACADNMEDD